MKILEDRGLWRSARAAPTLTAAPTPERVKLSLMRLFRDQPLPTLAEMEMMLELREILEETVASLAAVRATPQDIEAIETALAKMASNRSAEETIEGDLQFHLAIAKAAHNRFFEIVA